MMVAGGQRNASGQYALPDTQNQAWSSDQSRFGSRMLAKFGWHSGKGLGKKEDGIVEHVRVVKRSEALGLGAKPAGAGGEAALSSAVADFNAVLASLAAAAPAPSGRPKRARSGSEASAASSEAPPQASAGAAPVRLIGRFAHHRALRQKNVAGYSSADLQAILGTHALGAGGTVGGAGDAVALPSAPLVQRASISVSVKKPKKDKREKREKKDKRERRRAEAAAEEAQAAAAAAAAAAAEGAEESAEDREARRQARRERKRLKREQAGEE
jgi:Pin2-interacting protein X1